MAIKCPLGNDSFTEIRQNGDYYVDKTQFIAELLKNSFKVRLITRPRRFGKTLTMSMLEDFFDIGRNSKPDFEGLAIFQDKELCAAWMNQWPTVFLTLKSVSGKTFESAYGMFRFLVADLCKKYSFLESSGKVDDADKKVFTKLKFQESQDADLKNSLYLFTRMLNAHYGKPVILLIDEYDVPLAQAGEGGYYEEMLDVVRALFDKALKSNEFLKFAVITGCLRIAKESIFTGTNNFVSDTVSKSVFNQYIGFTKADVHRILKDAGFPDREEEVKHWYDGYRFGTVEIYCPWDVLNYVAALQVDERSVPESYWENTSHNGIIRRFIERRDLWEEERINEDFETLLSGGYIVKTITENLTYDMLHSSANNLWSLLYLTGYLTQVPGICETDDSSRKLALKIPNEEIRSLFKTTVAEWFKDQVKATDRTELFRALWGEDEQKCASILSKMIFNTISYHDYKEDYYHAFTAGVLSFSGYKVKSNREEGEGRPDILLEDEREGRAVIMEIKSAKTIGEMEEKCEEALKQIENRQYAKALEDEYEEVLCYGLCFFKKKCKAKVKKHR